MSFTAFCCLGLASVAILFVKERLSFSRLRHDIKSELGWTQFYEKSEEGWAYWLKFHLVDQLRAKRRRFTSRSSDYEVELDGPSTASRTWLAVRHTFWRMFSRTSKRRSGSIDSEAVGDTSIEKIKRPSAWQRGSKQPMTSRVDSTGRTLTDTLKSMHHQATEEAEASISSWYKDKVEQLGLRVKASMVSRVLHMTFSPDGNWLAVCFKYECCIFNAFVSLALQLSS